MRVLLPLDCRGKRKYWFAAFFSDLGLCSACRVASVGCRPSEMLSGPLQLSDPQKEKKQNYGNPCVCLLVVVRRRTGGDAFDSWRMLG